MLKIGITGGIGSGKTTICKMFELLGIPVYYADERAKWLMVHDPEIIKNLKKHFGKEVYNPSGALNRTYLAGIVFQDRSKLDMLNSIVHPAVQNDGERWHHQQDGAPFTLKEAALFFESGSYRQMDKMIVVTAPEQLRIQRVMERDQVDASAVKARIDKQLPESEKIKKADYLINNDGTSSLILQVLKIYSVIKQL